MRLSLLLVIIPALLGCSAKSASAPEISTAAAQWFERQGIKLDDVMERPLEETAKRLTQAVYAFCVDGPTPTDLDALFEECSTACGGYSYVLRGLLEALGAETRYANLYNIPNQGNHTAVEVKLGDRWGFFDPTFGVYFTEDGSAGGKTLSLRQIAYEIPQGELDGHVRQSRKALEPFVDEPIEGLFNEPFDHPYMALLNYQVAEHISVGEQSGFMLSLDIPLQIERGIASIGSIEAADLATLQGEWLTETNATLNDDDPINDTSFNASMLYNDGMERKTTLSLYGLQAGEQYELILLLHREGNMSGKVQVSSIGKAVRFPSSGVFEVPVGSALFAAKLLSYRETAQIEVRNMEEGGIVHLLGVRVHLTDHAPNSMTASRSYN